MKDNSNQVQEQSIPDPVGMQDALAFAASNLEFFKENFALS